MPANERFYVNAVHAMIYDVFYVFLTQVRIIVCTLDVLQLASNECLALGDL